MKIVIDMQGAQTLGSKNRGIGGYTRDLVKGLVDTNSGASIVLLLNASFYESVNEIKDYLSKNKLLVETKLWYPAKYSFIYGNQSLRKANKIMRDAVIDELMPDIVLISSLFEGYDNDAESSLPKGFQIRKTYKTAVILYDLIPYIFSSKYLLSVEYKNWYLNKVNELKKADLIFTISESSKRDGMKLLKLEEEKVFNISSCVDNMFKPVQISNLQKQKIFRKFGVKNKYILYVGGVDFRKNIEKLIEAYSRLHNSIKNDYQLLIICVVSDVEKKYYIKLALKFGVNQKDLVFTNYVTKEELLFLYNLCDLFVFSSLYEGFGLPVLEAMRCGKAVIGSNVSSIPEIIGMQDALFNPNDCSQITNKITEVINSVEFKKRLEKNSIKNSDNFSWQKTSRIVWGAIKSIIQIKEKTSEITRNNKIKPRLAYISPFKPLKSGISDFSSELLPYLDKHFSISVVSSTKKISDKWIIENCEILSINEFKKNALKFSRIVYSFGNSEFHVHMLDLLKNFPGVVILHDFFLSGLLHYVDLTTGSNKFNEALLNEHGYRALVERYESVDLKNTIMKYPCSFSVLQGSLGVVFHSKYTESLFKKNYGVEKSSCFKVIPILKKLPNIYGAEKDISRKKLGFSSDDFIICCFGYLGETKLNHEIITAFENADFSFKSSVYLVFVGKNDLNEYGLRLTKQISKMKQAKKYIKISGWVSSESYQDYLNVANIAVQLRHFSRGESSKSVLDTMSMSIPTIVNAHGSMDELPSDSVYKLRDKFDNKELTEALEKLHRNKLLRNQLAKNGNEYIKTFHDPKKYALLLSEHIEDVYSRNKIKTTAIYKIANECEQKCYFDISEVFVLNLPPKIRQKVLYVDVSDLMLVKTDEVYLRAKSLVNDLLSTSFGPYIGYIVRFVYKKIEDNRYYYADDAFEKIFNLKLMFKESCLINIGINDRLAKLDLSEETKLENIDVQNKYL